MDARAKFELRRKKILENAESRLQRITAGRFSNSLHSDTPPENRIDHSKANGSEDIVVRPELAAGPPPQLARDPIPSSSCVDHPVVTTRDLPGISAGDPLWNGGLPAVLNNNEPEALPDNKGRLDREQESRGAIGLLPQAKEGWKDYAAFLSLAVLVRLSFVFNYGWLVSENVLAPFLMVGLPRVVYLAGRRDWSSGNPLYGILLLANFRPANLTALFSVLYVLRQLSQFFAFYMFAFIIVHCSLESDPERT